MKNETPFEQLLLATCCLPVLVGRGMCKRDTVAEEVVIVG
jgi:hypothetical protein